MANKLILEGLTENELEKYFIRQNIENIPFQQGSSEQTLDTCKTNFVKCINQSSKKARITSQLPQPSLLFQEAVYRI